MSWVESVSPSFTARHEEDDADAVAVLLEDLEHARDRLAASFPRTPGELTVVVHPSTASLFLAQPYLPLARAITAPAGRRYLVGWFGAQEIHVLAPRVLIRRASSVPGSREALALAPAALYAQVVVGTNNPELPPPFTPRSFARHLRWAWLVHGAAQYFSGQADHLRAPVVRRLREGGRPDFPPGPRDAPLLAGTIYTLLVKEEGQEAAVKLASRLDPGGGRDALVSAFGGRSVERTEAAWRAHLDRFASA